MCVWQENKWNKINVTYIRIQEYEYTERMFASNRDKKPKYISNFQKNMAMMASNGPWPYSPSLHIGLTTPQPSRRHHAQSLLGPSFHDTGVPHVLGASRASLPPQRWATIYYRLSLRPCTTPLSCSLQPLLKLLLLSLRPSLLQCVSIVSLNCFTLAESQKPDVWNGVCVFTFSSSAFTLKVSDRNESQLKFPMFNLVVITTLTPQLLLLEHSFLAVSAILNHSNTCAVSSVCNAVGPRLLILLKLCPVFTFLQQLMAKGLRVIYTYTCSPRFSIDVIISALDNPWIYW